MQVYETKVVTLKRAYKVMICLFQSPSSPGRRRAMNSEDRTVREGGRRIRRSLGRRVPTLLLKQQTPSDTLVKDTDILRLTA